MAIARWIGPMLGTLLTAGGPALAQQAIAGSGCEPNPQTATVLNDLAVLRQSCAEGCRERARVLVERALALQPDDVFLHRERQALLYPVPALPSDELVTDYKRRLDREPDRALWLYLYGEALSGARADERLELYTRAVERDPSFVWAHAGLVALYSFGSHKDSAKAAEHVRAFQKSCPETLEIYRYAVRQDSPLNKDATERLRALLTHRRDPASFTFFDYLWPAEFRVFPDQHEAVRTRVGADLERLRALGLEDQMAWWRTLRRGYELLGDGKTRDEAERALLSRFPCALESGGLRRARWRKEHPFPKDEDDLAWQTYHGALQQASAEAVRRCPDSLEDWLDRLSSARPTEVPNDEFGRIADTFLRLWETPGRGLFISPSPYFEVARAFLARNMRLDEVAALAQRGRREDTPPRARADAPEAERRGVAKEDAALEWQALVLEARALARLRSSEASGAVGKLQVFLSGHEADGNDDAERVHRYRQGELLQVKAEWAQGAGRGADALAFYAAALKAQPDDGPLRAAAGKAWRDLGGTDEGWRTWAELGRTAKPADVPRPWKAKHAILADFALTDLAGRRWTRADLAGRAAFINVWATWCGPCMLELPLIEKLRQHLETRKDVVLITLNIDENPGLIAPLLEEKGYHFPVLWAQEWIQTVLDEVVVPRSWIVDRGGRLRFEQVGLGSDEVDTWLEDVLERLSSVTSTPGAASLRDSPPKD